jgi:cobalamin-dependent methionine synthase I
MSALQESRAHLAKAREFLEAGVISRDLELFEAATSAAVISGINSKDAICLRLVGVTRRSENHTDAVAELKAVGPAGARLAPTLSRLMRLKTKAQYQAASVAATDATKAVGWASRLVEAAEEIVSAR